MVNIDKELEEYEEKICKKFNSCEDCPANAQDLGYGNTHCGFDLVRDAIQQCRDE